MNIYQSSTKTSTNYQSLISDAEKALLAAQKAGARQTTIESLKERLDQAKKHEELDRKYKDIQFMSEWPNEILITRYEEATKYAEDFSAKMDDPGLFANKESQERSKHYESVLRIIERLEDEGRKRNLAFFLSTEEIQQIFSED